MTGLFKKGISLLLRRQTSILSAAYVIMATTVLSLLLGLIRTRLLVSIFGASNILGIWYASDEFPNFFFQLVIIAGLSSAFIPVYGEFLSKNKEDIARKMASSLLTIGLVIFALISIILSIFAPDFLRLINLGSGFSHPQIMLMANLMRIVILGQLLFIVGMFFTTLLQTYNHFLVPGLALATYNLGTIIGILLLSSRIGIYAPAVGTVLGSLIFIIVQIPLVKKVGFHFRPRFSFKDEGVKTVAKLMWPRAITSGIFQLGSLLTLSLVSFLPSAGRNYLIFDLAQTLAFAPVSFIGNAIAQAAFPVLSREKENKEVFRETFLSTFNQMLYLILPITALILVLRIPIVRLTYGAPRLDWDATVLTGRTLAFFSISIVVQSLIILISKAFYALHNTKTPLVVSSVTTFLMLAIAYPALTVYHLGISSLAVSYSIASIVQFVVLLYLLNKQTGGLGQTHEGLALIKLFTAAFFTAIALYIPLKLLDQLVFDTTRTQGLILLTGISSLIGLSIYLFLTWAFSVKEALTYVLMCKKFGNWQDILHRLKEVINPNPLNP